MICRIIVVIVLAVIGLIALISGILSNQLIHAIIRKQLSQRLPLVNGSQTLPKWSNVRVPIYMKYHIFSIMNLNETLAGEQPIFQEFGPYVFRQKVKKEILGWNEDETLITFKSRKTYFFEPTLSNGSLSDIVTIPNLPVIGMSTIAMEKTSFLTYYIAKGTVNTVIENSDAGPFVTLTVGELLFEGKHSPFLSNVKSILDTVGLEMPIPPDGKFCLMRGKNHTADGNWTIYTGKSSLDEFGSVVKWSNLSYLSCWSGDDCNRIEGTDGMMFHPFVSNEESIKLFSSDVKRHDLFPFVTHQFSMLSLSFTFEKNDVIEGIDAYKFTIPDEVFSAPRFSERNKCFCVAPEKEGQLDVCAYNAMLDMHTSLNGAPLVISLPHFYSSNESIINSTIGLKPSKEKHETFLKIDPVTGVVLSGAKRLQLNMHIRQDYGITILEKVKKGLYPIAWFEEGATMDAAIAGDLKSALHDKIALMKKVFLGVLISNLRKKEKNAQRNNYVYSNLKKTHDKEEIKNDHNRI
ncbi:platelet glycoprotein 4-like protein [Leptotrombidium deliense]|uniref:Platelet glycoprotein 4-like protein n=1 Tax=Leptotrombidium deliense TaxID=299467 RepID=A0A443SFZ5_9ACAR|nr:platelet glycoprotein 4-like protein [Leptotrombidium deliense]